MESESHRWYSERIGHEDIHVRVYGHFGQPILVFPTSGGDEREYEGQGMFDALGHHMQAGRVKFFCVNSVNNDSWYNKAIHPADRARFQVAYDSAIANESASLHRASLQRSGIAITTTGASFGAYHAANTLFKHPTQGAPLPRPFGRLRPALLHGRALRRQLLLQQSRRLPRESERLEHSPVPPSVRHPPRYRQAARYEDSGPTRRLAVHHRARGIPHHLDDWREQGGHDWPYWKHQMDVYISKLVLSGCALERNETRAARRCLLLVLLASSAPLSWSRRPPKPACALLKACGLAADALACTEEAQAHRSPVSPMTPRAAANRAICWLTGSGPALRDGASVFVHFSAGYRVVYDISGEAPVSAARFDFLAADLPLGGEARHPFLEDEVRDAVPLILGPGDSGRHARTGSRARRRSCSTTHPCEAAHVLRLGQLEAGTLAAPRLGLCGRPDPARIPRPRGPSLTT
jgi:esterase/lipase superfamily enzyme